MPPKTRRTQEQRTAETRAALFGAAVRTIDRLGYAAANNAAIADEAGVSRGAITHHFGTRHAFMAEVVNWVFERETGAFRARLARLEGGARASDWPQLLWEVLSAPSGVAVLEILVASRSDTALAALVKPMQSAVEGLGAANFLHRTEVTPSDMAAIRLVVWAIRGMTVGRAFISDPEEMSQAVTLFGRVLEAAAPSGEFDQLRGL